MNTTPLTFKTNQSQSCTIIGGKESKEGAAINACAVLLNSASNHLRENHIENLLKNKFSSVISIEHGASNYNVQKLSFRFPDVKFIIIHDTVSVGEAINIAVAECDEPWILVLRDTLKINSQLIIPKAFERITADSALFCAVPRLLDNAQRVLPLQFSPMVKNRRFAVDIAGTCFDTMKTLYPFDNTGLYNKTKFIALGGYDSSITSPYWQNLDLSVRAWLWGEEIRLSHLMQFSYESEIPENDQTANTDSLRFFLKNLSPVVRSDYGYIPINVFFGFLRRSRLGFAAAQKQFVDARAWVKTNKYRFRMDIEKLILSWQENDTEV
ncbi:MAG: hypothetical protein Ta2A_22200 [Treponemataceae bacterium]|nr:MAG: hypothetical protein Ta2A_22200 [Treponemataceae bacterium]